MIISNYSLTLTLLNFYLEAILEVVKFLLF